MVCIDILCFYLTKIILRWSDGLGGIDEIGLAVISLYYSTCECFKICSKTKS